jgi:secondary thiamine-phosphate synthase enzyme
MQSGGEGGRGARCSPAGGEINDEEAEMTDQLETLSIRTSAREEIVNITEQVQRVVNASGVRSGVVWVYSPHTTSGITIQENADPDVRIDLLAHLTELVPRKPGFLHAEGNSDAHIKSAMVGASQAVPVSDARLLLGTWQAIFFCEFDGPRSRRVIVKILGT